MTTGEAGEALGVSDSRVRQFIREGRLVARKMGHINIVHRRDVLKLAADLEASSPRKRGPKPNVMKRKPPEESR